MERVEARAEKRKEEPGATGYLLTERQKKSDFKEECI